MTVHSRVRASRSSAWFLALSLCSLVVAPLEAQTLDVVTISRGTSALLRQQTPIQRVSIGDPEIADAVVPSPLEVLVNGRALGTTSLIVWDNNNNTRTYTIEVTVDASALQRQFSALFPNQPISVTASGSVVVLSGAVTDAGVAQRALQLAQATGATIVDNLQIPPPNQILLQVRFAEVSRNAMERIGAEYLAGETSVSLDPRAPNPGDRVGGASVADGLVDLFLFEGDLQLGALVEALKRTGTFRSLAEPNLLALEGREAEFLAGGEFPYPVPQTGGGAGQGTITIQFREYGVRLRFLPTVTIAGNIRLEVAPEVSSLDFANGLTFQGLQVPALLTRRAETAVELRDGQTFAIAGLMDNRMQRNGSRIPVLGDIPILGPLFRSKDVQQNRTELLVLVTPRLVQPSNAPPPLPTGEPETWEWDRQLRGRTPSEMN
jgi:pilus assembly protein CpaC